MNVQSAEERVARDRQKYLESIPRYLKGDSSTLPKYHPDYNTLLVALGAELPTVDKSKLNERIVALFKQHKDNKKLDKNKLNDYFVKALQSKNYPLVLWLAKEKDEYICFLQQFVNEMRECEGNENLQECIQNVVNRSFQSIVNTTKDEYCIELFLTLGITFNKDLFNKIAKHSVNNLNIIKLLIKNGLDVVESRIEYDTTLLDHAVENNNIEVVKFLLDNKAKDYRAVDIAIENDNIEILKLLFNNNIYLRLDSLDKAIRRDNKEIVKLILDIHYAPYIGYPSYTREKLKLSLYTAIIYDKPKSVKLLLDLIPNINKVIYKYDLTPLMLASRDGYTDIVKLLIEKGAKINVVDDLNLTPLMYASSNGHKDTVEYLIEKGANVNFKNKNSQTALISALRSCDHSIQNNIFKTAELLLNKGAKVNFKDTLNKTPLDYAKECPDKKFENLIRSKL